MALLAVGSMYLGAKLAHTVDQHSVARVEAQPALSRESISEHLNNAALALEYIESTRDVYVFGFEFPSGQNARPNLARSELEGVLGSFPYSYRAQEQRVRAVYDSLPHEQMSSRSFEPERAELLKVRDSLR